MRQGACMTATSRLAEDLTLHRRPPAAILTDGIRHGCRPPRSKSGPVGSALVVTDGGWEWKLQGEADLSFDECEDAEGV